MHRGVPGRPPEPNQLCGRGGAAGRTVQTRRGPRNGPHGAPHAERGREAREPAEPPDGTADA
eukprot:8592269-Lingulodinium_polyedra.AAC.1